MSVSSVCLMAAAAAVHPFCFRLERSQGWRWPGRYWDTGPRSYNFAGIHGPASSKKPGSMPGSGQNNKDPIGLALSCRFNSISVCWNSWCGSSSSSFCSTLQNSNNLIEWHLAQHCVHGVCQIWCRQPSSTVGQCAQQPHSSVLYSYYTASCTTTSVQLSAHVTSEPVSHP